MLRRLRQRWQVVPTWLKLAPIVALVAVLSVLNHMETPQQDWLVPLVHRLFLLPIFMASLLFGLTGGLICAAAVMLNLVPELWQPHGEYGSTLLVWLEMALYVLTAAITGLLVDRERREAQRLKRAENLALLGEAAAQVAHELKTPLVAIGGFAGRILRDVPQDHPHQRQLTIIVDQVAHMEQLLREMLDYSRPLELNLAPQPMNEMVQEVLALAQGLAAEQGVRLVEHLDQELGFPVVDGPRIKQVVLNLVQNAVQASSKGSTVWISTKLGEDRVLVEVADQGSGIAPEHREKLFYPFFTTKSGGTGLGLAISHKIVSAHGGELELAQSGEAGSTFRVSLPLNGPG